ncbi:MAG: hypothetical protein EOO65_00440 [Methanosarcinales archaeon]|nr:MAG: hypothetical protein EOO65_00440 [Methanosarcinales archaeon]
MANVGTFRHFQTLPMPRKTISEPVWIESRKRWKVDVPASLSHNGDRMRAFFKTRILAREYIENLSSEGAEDPAAIISPRLALEADKARGILESCNLDLVQAARTVKEALALLEGTGGTIKEACGLFAKTHTAMTASVPFKDAVAKYLDSRSNLRESTLSSYRYTLEGAFKDLDERQLAGIGTGDLEALLAGKGPTATAMHLRNLGAFWRWASKQPRRWAQVETFDALERPRSSSDSDIEILRPAEVKALLKSAESESKAAAISFAIAIFGGVRMAELERLTWGHILQDHIEIGKSVAKKHSRRLVPICQTLQAWFEGCRGNSKETDLIVPPNWKDVSKSVRRRAGWNVSARLLKNPPNPTRGTWPANSPRHTCASVMVAIGTPLEDLIFKFGHSGGHELLKSNYVARLTKEDALSILRIGPRGTTVDNLSV